MKIIRVQAIPFAIPYRKPLRFASGEVSRAEHVLVRVHTDDGVTGTAEAPPRPFTYGETQQSIIAIIRDIFTPQIVGLSPLEREQIHGRLDRTVGNPAAKAAIDMAVWDIIGQSVGLPLTELLGGYGNQMRVCHMVGFAEAGEMAAEARRMHDSYGITTFKVKVGRRRSGWTSPPAAHCGKRWEIAPKSTSTATAGGQRPTPHGRCARWRTSTCSSPRNSARQTTFLGRRWLVAHSTIPIFADESVPTPGDVTRELLGGSATGISIKTARTGFTRSHRILAQCEGLGVEVVMGNQIDGQIGSLCSLAFGAAFERTSRRAGELSNFLDMSDDLLTEPLQIRDGALRVREAPGTGIDIDEDKLAHYRIDR